MVPVSPALLARFGPHSVSSTSSYVTVALAAVDRGVALRRHRFGRSSSQICDQVEETDDKMGETPMLEERASVSPPFALAAVEESDEIRAVDLLVNIVRRKWLFGSALAGLFAATLLIWFLLPAKYRYRTTVELGGTVAAEKIQPLEPAPSAMAKLRSTWIPTYRERLPEPDDEPIQFSVSIPRGTNLLVLESRGIAAREQQHAWGHEAVLRPLLSEHGTMEETLRQQLETELTVEKLRLESIEDEYHVLTTQHELLKEEEGILQEEARKLRVQIAESQKQWRDSVIAVEEDTRAVILLMLETEIRKNRDRLEDLNKRLRIGLPNQRAELEKDQQESARNQQRQAVIIAEVEGRVRTFRGSRRIGQAVRSEPGGFGGLGWPAAVLLAAIVGFMAALAAVILALLREELRLRLGS